MTKYPSRREALAVIAAGVALPHLQANAKCPADPLTVCNVTQLNSVKVTDVMTVRDAGDVRNALRKWSGPVSVGGGRFSMGGQTAIAGGIQLDMRRMNAIVKFDPSARTARVQAGMRWRDLQDAIDPHGLSVRTMQSYASFTVGGSVSVNCHGRYVGHGPVSRTVRAIQLVLPHGEIVEASRQTNSDLFYAAIGGYGGVGVITEVELDLDENFRIERTTAYVTLEDYPAWFREQIQSNPQVLLHNADLIPYTFDTPRCVTWVRTDKPQTIEAGLTPRGGKYTREQLFIWAMTELPGGASLRKSVTRSMEEKPAVVWRNFEASLDVAQLEPASRDVSTYVLQEYFVPEDQFPGFARKMAKLMQTTRTGTVNVSIRHSPSDEGVWMAWARRDVFSFVVYYKQAVSLEAQRKVGEWTRAMIDLALSHGGTYYLPYQLHATQEQFQRAYPDAGRFKKLRQDIGASRFTNTMWSQYQV
ncbi:MAG: FAD-binding oxidoreductase [Polaromonas sp.]|nr:FAD-binding oxidoreductase [Polaromonas sp.]